MCGILTVVAIELGGISKALKIMIQMQVQNKDKKNN
jgi:hypothetical protein